MLEPDIPQDARDLIQRHLATMDHVECLMALRADRGRSLSVPEIAAVIRKPESLVVACVESLCGAGLVAQLSDGTYRYAARDETVDGAAESVVRLYNERPVTLVRLLYERPPGAVSTFADAFKLRKDT